MKVTKEIRQWLSDNAYAVKSNGDMYSLSEFPKEDTPDHLRIPIRKIDWQSLLQAGEK